jgi:hypothetical protein
MTAPTRTMARIELFKKSASRNTEFERYLVSSEPKPSGPIITLDSTRSYVITLPLSYFVSKGSAKRTKGKADAMPFESFRIINVQHRGGNAHSLVLIKSRAIKSNPHHIAIFESNGRNGFCGILADEMGLGKTMQTILSIRLLFQAGLVKRVLLICPKPLVFNWTRDLKLWASYSDADGGLLDKAVTFPTGANVEKTLVLIKPDNFRFPNARPGGVIDLFSRTGLYIIACKVHRMSVAQAEEFYGPVLAVLQDKLRGRSGEIARKVLEQELSITLGDDVQTKLGDLLGRAVGLRHGRAVGLVRLPGAVKDVAVVRGEVLPHPDHTSAVGCLDHRAEPDSPILLGIVPKWLAP